MADSFEENILGVKNLIDSDINKTASDGIQTEGVETEYIDTLSLEMTDVKLLELKDSWMLKHDGYYPRIEARQKNNKKYYQGRQYSSGVQDDTIIASNLIFEAEETFIPQALSKNPEPVVWSDNTAEGKEASNNIKTMLQHKADTMGLRQKLSIMVRHWSIYFTGVLKHGWDKEANDICTELRKPQNFILDPDGYVDEFGTFCGDFLGERIPSTAQKLIDLFPSKKDYILIKVDGKLGTTVNYTEWWTDKYCFTTFMDIVLDKHKNEFFNYDKTDVNSQEDQDEYGMESETVTPGKNHFAVPKMPYTFLSVFTLQEQPHDITNLIEQNIPNQERISERDLQITKNLRTGNNSLIVSGLSFTAETARQAAQAIEDGDPIIIPNGQMESVKRIPASPLPSGVLESQQIDKDTLRGVFGVQGISSQQQDENTTARGMILNQSHDSTRIGGGIGDSLEQVADNVFNWWLQLFYVFYDEKHYGAIMGSGRAIEYVQLVNADMDRQFVVSVSPNSMQPKDEITEQNLAIDLANKGWLDPLTLFQKLNYADPTETAKKVVLWKMSPEMYMQKYFPEDMQAMAQQQAMQGDPGDVPQPGMPPPDTGLGAPPADGSLSAVPISTEAMPQ